MSTFTFNKLDFLLKEIADPYVQENFYKLKLFIEENNIGPGLIGPPGVAGPVGPPGTTQLKKVMGCDVSAAVSDWVFQSTTVDNFAIVATDNNPLKPVNGIIVAKPTPTSADVMFLGITSYVVGRGDIFLGATGTAVTTAPATGFIQRLGISFGDGEILVRPDWTRVKKI